MYTTTASELTALGFAVTRGAGERIQYWHRTNAAGLNEAVIHDSVAGRTWPTNGDGRTESVAVACATVLMTAIAALPVSQAIKNAQTQIILDSLGHI